MTFYVKSNNKSSTLSAIMNTDDPITLSVVDGSGFPTTYPYLLTIWDKASYPNPGDDVGSEIVRCTLRVGNDLTVVRDQESSGNKAHSIGETVAMLVTAGIMNDSTYGIEGNIDTHILNTSTHGVSGTIQGSEDKDVNGGIAALDANGHLQSKNYRVLVPRGAAEQITLRERTSDERAVRVFRNGANDYEMKINESGVEQSVIIDNDARLSDSRTPTAHKASHITGGGDIIDESSVGANGLLKALDNDSAHYMNGQGNWATPAGGGGSSIVNIYLPAEAAYLPDTNPAALTEVVGTTTYGGWSYLAFDDTTSEHAVWRCPMPDYDGGNIIVTSYTKPATTPSGAVTLQFNILTIGLANSEAFNTAVTIDTSVNLSQSMNTTELLTDICVTTATIDPANVASDDLLVIELSRDVTNDNLTGDGELIGLMIEYTRS